MEFDKFQIRLTDEELQRETQELLALRDTGLNTRSETVPPPPEVLSIMTAMTKDVKQRYKDKWPLFPLIRKYEAQLKEHGCSFKKGWFGSSLKAGTGEATFINPENYTSNKGRVAIPPVIDAQNQTLIGAIALTLPSNGHPHEEKIFRPW